VISFSDYTLIDTAFQNQGSPLFDGDTGNRLVELGQMWHFRLDGYLDYLIAYEKEVFGLDLTYADFYPNGLPQWLNSVPEPSAFCVAGLAMSICASRRRRRR
jgi:hypothetical protein